MGIQVDGCGTDEKAVKIKCVGDFFCESCKTNRSFYIFEVTKRATVFYIPVAKLSKKYGVFCEKCERGYFIEEDQANTALTGNLAYVTSLLIEEEPVKIPESQESMPKPFECSQSSCVLCSSCGYEIESGMLFCTNCGAKINEIKEDFCLRCGTTIQPGMTVCSRCGYEVG